MKIKLWQFLGIILILSGCDCVTNPPFPDPIEEVCDTLTWYVNYDNGVPVDTVYLTTCDMILPLSGD